MLADFTRDFDAATWRPRLIGIDVVVNAVGIIQEKGAQTFEALHVRAPCALFQACVDAGVDRVIQVSALGADDDATSAYHITKREADEFLSSLPIASAIVQPSLVYGPGGESARLFDTLASLPLIPLPGDGSQRVQPIHIDDLVSCIAALVEGGHRHAARIALVGAEPLTLRDYLGALRRALGGSPPRFVRIPRLAVALGARIGGVLETRLLDHETLSMLERGNTADVSATIQLLGRRPRKVAEFVPQRDAGTTRRQAQLNWLLPVLRLALAAMWIVTGIVSLVVYPLAESYALLARTGITGTFAPLALGGAAALDLALGIATLVAPSRRLWLGQIALIAGYTLVISWFLPEFWAHPYGPVLKNVPILAMLWLLAVLEEER